MAAGRRESKQAGPVKRRLQAAGMRVFMPLVCEKAAGWLYDHRPVLGAPAGAPS